MKDYLIVGGGIAGLTLAFNLQEKSIITSRILDKGNGIGGRLASRKMSYEGEESIFDFGTQFIDSSESEFDRFNSLLFEKNIIQEINFGLKNNNENLPHRFFVSKDGIRSIAKYLAEKLDFKVKTKVTGIHFINEVWNLVDDKGEIHKAKGLVLTPPMPQAINLLGDVSQYFDENQIEILKKVEYERTIAILIISQNASFFDNEVFIRPNSDNIHLIVNNKRKGLTEKLNSFTIILNNHFALQHWDEELEIIYDNIRHEIEEGLGINILNYHVHKWKYSRPISVIPEYFISNDKMNLHICGDSFYAPSVEGAYLSGYNLSNKLINR